MKSFGTGLRAIMLAGVGAFLFNAAPAKAQNADAAFRVNELEQQVRKLTGRVEELTFQLLELQETLRKMQQDNEFRFQEIEEKQSGALPSTESDRKVADAEDEGLGKPSPSTAEAADGSNDTEALASPGQAAPKPSDDLQPRQLGTLTFDAQGNVVQPKGDAPSTGELPPGVFSDGVVGGAEAAEFGATPDEVFAAGITALERKRPRLAEQAFRSHMKAWPEDPRMPEARYYLAEALFRQRNYYDAANIFLDTHNAHPQARTAADNLLGLGLSLAGLNQREVACATYSEVLKQYPADAARLQSRVQAEQASARC